METGVRKFQREIHTTFNDFDPDGLQKWIVDNSGKFNDVTRTFTEKMEEGIRQKVFSVLQDKFGSNWWKISIPTEIQKSAAILRIEAKSDDDDSEFLHLPDYKKIISKHWEPFKPIFADPAFKSNKDNQLDWFDTLINLRNKVSHVKNKKAGQEDHEFVTKLNEWLPARLDMDKMNTAV